MVTICACDSYKDSNNNTISGKIENCKIVFKGKNSIIRVSDGFRIYGNGTVIIVEDSCDITFGKSFQVGRESILCFKTGCKVSIGDYASLDNYSRVFCQGTINISDHFCMREYSELRVHGNLIFDSWVYLQHHVTIYVPKQSELYVGKDSGFSWYSKVVSGSGHSTFDLKHEVKIEEIISKQSGIKRLYIGNHVWVGCGSIIHSEVSIGDNCLVASGSIVYAGSFPNHVVIEGNPAKAIVSNFDWDRRTDLSYEDFKEYRKSGKIIIERPSFYDEYL